jgi:hypothetical protein
MLYCIINIITYHKMHFHVHVTIPDIEHGLDAVGHIAGGGAISNGAEALSSGISTVEDIKQHQYGDAVVNGVETVYHGAEAVIDGIAGNWL